MAIYFNGNKRKSMNGKEYFKYLVEKYEKENRKKCKRCVVGTLGKCIICDKK